MHILVVEDDPKTRRYLRKGLIEHGFTVTDAADGEDGLHLARHGSFALAVIDVMLPGRDGWSIVSELRAGGSSLPVLFLTARDSVSDRVRGLDLGADDYLVKPFAFSELLARVRSISRRGGAAPAVPSVVGDLEVDPIRRRVSRGGRRIDLTPKEFSLLALLVEHRGEVLTRTRIAEEVWDMNFDSDTNVIDVAVRRLRLKIDDPEPEKLIHTVRGVGYVLDER